MAELFEVQKAAISKHLKNIFASGELQEEAVVSKMETTAEDGKRDNTTACFYFITHQPLHLVLQSVLALLAEMNADNIGCVAHSHVERACGIGPCGFYGCGVLCHAIPP